MEGCMEYVRDTPVETVAMHNLAVLHTQAGRAAESVSPLTTVLERERERGDVRTVANAQLSLATAHLRLRQIDRAEPLLKNALYASGREGDQGMAASCEQALGSLCVLRGDAVGAAKRYRRASQLFRDIDSSSANLSGTDSEQAYGHTLLAVGKTQEALAVLDGLTGTMERVYGENSPHTAGGYVGIGNALRQQGRAKEAVMFYKKALHIYSGCYGLMHPFCATCHVNIGCVQLSELKHSAAIQSFNKARAIREDVLDQSPDTQRVYLLLATTYESMATQAQDKPVRVPGKGTLPLTRTQCINEAIRWYRKALKHVEALFGKSSDESTQINRSVAALLRRKSQKA
ncbi:hypothetical protein KIPB_008065 [Kipferlia bialata]|uniref:MalT-like TPR region domain-containing protein n=1 Tax=Kipferlia bialata TaxID=797122 RepID=A0A9K3GKH8_9EUKA|nr:hypothetical protein KIPB_008065 [Kipferlia bialata]|eukprot:g8065.t1